MKRAVYSVCLIYLVCLAPLSFAQGVRMGETPGLIWTTGTVAGIPNVLLAVPVSSVSICTAPANAVPCTNKATTYNSRALTTACSLSTQVTMGTSTSCLAAPDGTGNWGVWLPAGDFEYTITANGSSYGPYALTAASGSGGGGNGNATKIQGKDVDTPVTTGCLLAYNGTKFTCALGTSSNVDSSIEKTSNKDIASGYLGIDSSGNSNVAHDLTVGNTLSVAGPWLLTSIAAAAPLGPAPSGKTVTGVDNDGLLGMSRYPGPFGKIPMEQGKVDVLGSTAAIGATTIYASAPAGFYQAVITANSTTTCSDVTAGSVIFNIIYTDSVGVVTKSTLAMAFTTTGHAAPAIPPIVFFSAAANIQYSTTYVACTTGTGTYNLHIRLMRTSN